MADLRWRTALLQAAVVDKLTAALTALGWMPGVAPWAENAVVVQDDWDAEALLAGEAAPAPNLVGVSTGDIEDALVEELGARNGGLMRYRIPVYVDVYGESRPIAMRLGDDIRDSLLGVQYQATRAIPILDRSTTPATPVSDELCQAQLVVARWPQQVGTQEWRRAWRIVAFTAAWDFNGAALEVPTP